MPPTRPTVLAPSDRADRSARFVVVCVVALVAVMGVWRGVDLVRFGWRPSAPGELRWLEWATGNPAERELRAKLLELSEPPVHTEATGDIVLRVMADRPVRADWVHVMAQYRWPALRVLAVEVEGQGRSGPPRDELVGVPVLRVWAPEGAVGAGPERSGPGRSASGPLAIYGLVLLAGAALWILRGPRPDPLLPSVDRSPDGRDVTGLVAESVLLAALALFVWKVLAAPLWSWDHYAIWGMKARRLAELGARGANLGDWLAGPAFPYAATDYPLGWPWLLSLASMGKAGGPALFKGAHLLCGVLLGLAVREAVRRGGGDRSAAAAAGALTAASPLLWDTESLGLADLPLATLATIGVVLIVESRRRLLRCRVLRLAGSGSGWHLLAAGGALGALPWVKQEGWALGVWLLLAAMLMLAWEPWEGRWEWTGRRKSLALLASPCLTLWLLQPVVHASLVAPATSFLSGDWQGRVLARLSDLPAILGHMAVDLIHPAWLLVWVLFAPSVVVSVANRRWLPSILGGVVVAQMGVYVAIYLATYLDPAAHILSSFVRIAAALGPLAVVTIFLSLAPWRLDNLEVR